MIEIDAIIDDTPTAKMIKELAELRIRNLQAFHELEAFNKTGEFLNRHPLMAHYSTRVQLEQLLKDSPDTFLEEYANCRENVKRYRCFLNNKDRNKHQKEKDKNNLKKHSERELLMKEILSQAK